MRCCAFPPLRYSLFALLLALTGCAGVGSSLKRGESSLADVITAIGEPAMRWQDPDGREQLAFPKGPAGSETFMVFTDRDGRLERFEKVLDVQHFAQIEIDKSNKDSVLRLLGPSSAFETRYFDGSNELVWEWLYCNGLYQEEFFGVKFDATTGVVRSTYQRLNVIPGFNGSVIPPCGPWVVSVQ